MPWWGLAGNVFPSHTLSGQMTPESFGSPGEDITRFFFTASLNVSTLIFSPYSKGRKSASSINKTRVLRFEGAEANANWRFSSPGLFAEDDFRFAKDTDQSVKSVSSQARCVTKPSSKPSCA